MTSHTKLHKKIQEEHAMELLAYCSASNSLVRQGQEPLPIDDLIKKLTSSHIAILENEMGELEGMKFENGNSWFQTKTKEIRQVAHNEALTDSQERLRKEIIKLKRLLK